MEAIVLAGGLGTRLRSVIPDLPKPMAPIAGRPFLELLLGSLSQKGFTRVVLSLGFMADVVIAHFGDRFKGMELVYAIEDIPLGTGGAVRLALTHCAADHVYVFNGDTFLDLDISAVEAQWQAKQLPIIISIEVPDTGRYGRLLTEHGLVTGFAEKGLVGPGLINAGCYVLGKDRLDAFPLKTPFSLETDYLAKEVLNTTIEVYVTTGQFIDIGVPKDFARAQNYLII